MPIYWFKYETRVTTDVAMAQIKELVAPPRPFLGVFRVDIDSGPPFIGRVAGHTFRVHRDIRYRNAFLPRVWGRISSVPTGAHIRVIMFLHPLMALFMLFWFSGVGAGVWQFFNAPPGWDHWVFAVPFGLLIFGVALVCGGFFPEAVRARRILEQALPKVKSPNQAL